MTRRLWRVSLRFPARATGKAPPMTRYFIYFDVYYRFYHSYSQTTQELLTAQRNVEFTTYTYNRASADMDNASKVFDHAMNYFGQSKQRMMEAQRELADLETSDLLVLGVE